MADTDAVGVGPGPLRRWCGQLLFTNEGDVHHRPRRLVQVAFTPRSVEQLRADTAAQARLRMDALAADGGGDLVEAFRLLATCGTRRRTRAAHRGPGRAPGRRWCDDLRPSCTHSSSTKEQTLLVAPEPARLAELSEDELDDVLTLDSIAGRETRTPSSIGASRPTSCQHRHLDGTSTSNQRTKCRAEIFDEARARVARSRASAESATAKELKRERLDAARAAEGTSASAQAGPARTRRTAKGPCTSRSRQASTNALCARKQAKRDSR